MRSKNTLAKACSDDLRRKILETYDRKLESLRELTERFCVSYTWARKISWQRWIASPEVLPRMLLSLDYVLERPELSWLPTEPEKVRDFDILGIGHQHLPRWVCRGAVGAT